MYFRNLIVCLMFSLILAQVPSEKRKFNGLIGGRDPKPGEVKYIVAVRSSIYICGGGIIGDKYILTAAHCVHIDKKTGKLLQPMKIVAGTNVATGYNPARVIEINVTRAFLPTIDFRANNADIAVLELKKKLNFIKYHRRIKKLRLPQPLFNNPSIYPSYNNLHVKFAGYGNTQTTTVYKDGKNETKHSGYGPLKVANATIVDNVTCRTFYQTARYDAMCLNVTEDPTKRNPQGTCKGDSGSPAVYNNDVIIGVDSMGFYCNNNLAPSLFTRVSTFIPFIKKAMRGDVQGLVVYEA